MTPTTTPPPTSGTRQANRERTRTLMLDAAEQLFADRGYFGVSVRDITEHAGVRVASVSDHFGGKENLFREVLLRRIRPINQDRLERLASPPPARSRAQRLRHIIHAFTGPLLDRAHDNQGWRYYFSFVAQLANSGQSVQLLVAEEYNSGAADFMNAFRNLFPSASEIAINDAYLLMVASTLHVFADTMRLDVITAGQLHSADIHQRYASLLEFLEGGLTQLLRAH